jgi:hypothetical protein
MQFAASSYTAPIPEIAARVALLLPEYLPGTETGPATITDLRSCWIKSTRHLIETLGREYNLPVHSEQKGDVTARQQLRCYWKRGDAIALAAFSGWGDRDELERSFQALEQLKAAQKVIIYTCARWQDAVLDQLSGALLRYPDHIEGEQYIALNILAAESRLIAHARQIGPGGARSMYDLTFDSVPGSPFALGASRSAMASPKP